MSLAFWKQCCMYNLANSQDLQSYNMPIVFPSIQRCRLNSSIVQNNINTVLFPLLLLHCATLLVLVPEIHWTCHCVLFGLPSTFLTFKYTQRAALFLCLKSLFYLSAIYFSGYCTDVQHITSITQLNTDRLCNQVHQSTRTASAALP